MWTKLERSGMMMSRGGRELPDSPRRWCTTSMRHQPQSIEHRKAVILAVPAGGCWRSRTPIRTITSKIDHRWR
jgi:hypothetical protein